MDDLPIRLTLWPRIQQLMIDQWGNENQNRLARDAHVGVATVARIKAGDSSIGLNVVEKIAAAFGLSPWQLLCPADELKSLTARCGPLARDLARSLDQIQDPETQRRAYAVAAQVISFRASPAAHVEPLPETLPSSVPEREQ